jgi:hypothetical protein
LPPSTREAVMKLFTIGTTLMALLTVNYGQLEPRMDITTSYDDNVLLAPQPVSDMITDLNLYLGYQGQSGTSSFYYQGDLLLFRQLAYYNASMHELGFDYVKSMTEHALYFGGAAAFKFNQNQYTLYNYQQLYLYGTLRLAFNTFLLKAGYNYRYRYYTNMAEIVNSQHYLFVQLNKSYSTGTSMLFESDLGYKLYPNQGYTPTAGRRGGRNQKEDQPEFSYSHIILLARIGQSLHPKIGIHMRYRKQIGLAHISYAVNSYDYTQNEEIFDDPFSYDSDTYASQLTWHLPAAFTVVASARYSDKSYRSETVYATPLEAAAAGEYRHDRQQVLSFALYKTIYFNKNWLRSWQLTLHYDTIHNSSNSYWYRYANAIYRFNLAWEL